MNTAEITNVVNPLISALESEAADTYVPKVTTVNGHALSSDVSITSGDVGLGNVTNTSDANKPVSTAQAAAIAAIPAPQWIKVTKTYTNFATAALANDISIYTLPIKGYVHDVKIVASTAFSGGTISAATISIGKAGALTRYTPVVDVFTGNSSLLAAHAPLPYCESMVATTDIRAAIIVVGVAQTLNNLSAGSVDIYLLISTLPS